MKPVRYPFSAIVGQETMKMALVLNAVDPSLGGVLIRGHKGTGKSTAARALAQLLPPIDVVESCPFNSDPRAPVDWVGVAIEGHRKRGAARIVRRPMPFVELPLNATEDRLVGSLHIESALRSGKRIFEPGLLAAANRGILYVDEVNLLDDHLVDMLLDAAASGINVVEREGISFAHPARFILIGTMNPEEGELRPQFLDRFGLCAAVESIAGLDSREAIVRRHLSFENDPGGFRSQWDRADALISHQIVRAGERLPQIAIPEQMMAMAVRLTQALQVQGHRADITVLKAARAHAALLEKVRIESEDIAEAARIAVPHRMKSSALDTAESLRLKIDRALLGLCEAGLQGGAAISPEEVQDDLAEKMQVPGAMAAGSILFSFLSDKKKEPVFEADTRIGPVEVEIDDLLDDKRGTPGRAKAKIIARGGRYRRAVPVHDGERDYAIALDATLRQAALRRSMERASAGESPSLKPEDLRKKQYIRPCGNLIVFVVDSSDSMGSGAVARMKAAKGAILAILRKAYQARSEVAMIVFGGEKARLALPPTSSIDNAKRLLASLPTGGATPFADGLYQAWQLIRLERVKNPGVRAVMVIVSDGEANVPISAAAAPLEELANIAEKVGQDGIEAVFIDAATDHRRGKEMQHLSNRMRASYIWMRDLTAGRLLKTVRERI